MGATVLSDMVVMVTWEEVPEGERNGVIIVYEVLLMSSGDADVAMTNTTDLTVNVTGLEGFILYKVTVSAYTAVGQGPASSPPVQAMTVQGSKSLGMLSIC